jgi:membrane protein implicated in regulation of membrane protease activity
MNFADMDPAWWWLIAAAIFAVTELAIPGVFLVWVAAAALLTGLCTFAFGLTLPYQVVLFGLFCIASVLAGRRLYERSAHTTTDPLLNDRAARLIGQTVTVVSAIEDGEGRVRVGDTVWSARGPDTVAGTRMRVSGVDGACLRVTPLGPDRLSDGRTGA